MTQYSAISPAVPGGTHARSDLLPDIPHSPEDARLRSKCVILHFRPLKHHYVSQLKAGCIQGGSTLIYPGPTGVVN